MRYMARNPEGYRSGNASEPWYCRSDRGLAIKKSFERTREIQTYPNDLVQFLGSF